MPHDVVVDAESLRAEVREKYRAVAVEPAGAYHFYTGRSLAGRLGDDTETLDALPDQAMESFAGVANPFCVVLVARVAPRLYCLLRAASRRIIKRIGPRELVRDPARIRLHVRRTLRGCHRACRRHARRGTRSARSSAPTAR